MVTYRALDFCFDSCLPLYEGEFILDILGGLGIASFFKNGKVVKLVSLYIIIIIIIIILIIIKILLIEPMTNRARYTHNKCKCKCK